MLFRVIMKSSVELEGYMKYMKLVILSRTIIKWNNSFY
jgi:hypothetical protein